jgi:hypothetical protein
MELPVPQNVLSTLHKLHGELQRKLAELSTKQSRLENELQAVAKEIEFTQAR